MNHSAARSNWTVNGYEGEYRPVWASSWRPVRLNGRPVYFTTALAAEVAAWRVLYAVEQRVMKRDGEIVFAAKSAADRLFRKGKVVEVERMGESA
ncbi:hypothetical protein ACFFP0_24660 [Rhizobium puerariae]|uniref:Uncharacterized protein n=1 Tax=Rhizobium puerariae TaxID=1585791 RepID=A0ABV6AN59_9HYPH